jgi:GGDEF domain-containing protein
MTRSVTSSAIAWFRKSRNGSRPVCQAATPVAEVARLGGDEFIVLAPGVAGPDAAANLAASILESFAQPMTLDSHEVVVSASLGIAVHPWMALTVNRC